MIEELWRPFPGYPQYEVSDRGNVRNIRTHYAMKLCLSRSKQNVQATVTVTLTRPDGRPGKAVVHQAVLRAFVGERPREHVASHIDGDATNNFTTNLIWDTVHVHNMRKRARGTSRQSEANHHAKLTPALVLKLRTRAAAGETQVDLAREHHVSISTVNLLCQGKTWQNVGGPILGRQNARLLPAKPIQGHSVCRRKFACPNCWAQSGHPVQCLAPAEDRRMCLTHAPEETS